MTPAVNYKILPSGDFYCYSHDSSFGYSQPKNGMTYFARGDERLVRKLKIYVYVFNKDNPKEVKDELLNATKALFKSAFNQEMPREISLGVSNGKPNTWKFESYNIELKKDLWHDKNGYEYNFIVRDPSFIRE
ncbi:MAG: hypothetical protein PSV17_12990 [Methylotenera sp.]|uniref:hypothetical protein n=1 Tax=Methylotenera sp. TaxID=2051956 RepID=UPI00248A489D|nr:hypothetical protein [Methylotenera sp.]MDI1310327.1 hypothetical protein [Methylotenera sp.]